MTSPLSTRERFLAFRKSLPRPPRLTRHHVQARGLDFAAFSTPTVGGLPPLVCVNGGLLFDHKLLWPALSPLAEHRQLILYDQRGRGASKVPPGHHVARIEHDAGDLRAIREALGIEQWDVLGHSWGGGIALLASARDQQAVRRLVLVNAVGPRSESWLPHMHAAALDRLGPAEREVLQRLDTSHLTRSDPAIHAEYTRAIYPAWFADPDMAQLFTPPRSNSQTGTSVAARLRREGYDWSAVVRGVRVETLVLHGAADLLPVSVARELVALLPAARLVLLPNAGHMPFWEAPEAFFRQVESFLQHS